MVYTKLISALRVKGDAAQVTTFGSNMQILWPLIILLTLSARGLSFRVVRIWRLAEQKHVYFPRKGC